MSGREQYAPGPTSGAAVRRDGEPRILILARELRHSPEKVKVIYWTSTILLASGMLAGGLGQVFHTKRSVDLIVHLGYPSYFLYILGVWQILGVIAILIPNFRLLKEWAYAGLLFIYTGASASRFLAGDPADIWPGPLLFALISMTSWKLRPVSRKLQPSQVEPGEYGRSKAISYWIVTGLVAFILISGGFWLMSNSELLVDQNPPLGFPAYFWKILGFCKLLGGIAILIPRFPVAKEWAYAGIVFNMTGASAARAFISDSAAHIIAPLVICGIAIASWMLRPESRKLNPTRMVNIDSKEEAKLPNAWINQN